MPTYDYRCPDGHEFERFQRMSDDPRAECPTCGKEAERVISGGAGFLFKGEGFYITDYRSDEYRKKASAEKGSGGSAGGGSGEAGSSGAGGSDASSTSAGSSGESDSASSSSTSET